MRLGAVRVRYGPWLDIVRRLNMRSRLVVFGAAAALALYVNITARSQSTPPGRPVILGSFVQGQYSNEVLRIALELPPSWQIANLAESEEFSRRLPRRMNLWFRSDDDSLLVAAFPVEPDEKLDEVYKVSLLGVARWRAVPHHWGASPKQD